MIIGIPKETLPMEARVSITPSVVKSIIQLGYKVKVEKNAGILSNFYDDDYKEAGASIVTNEDIWKSDVIYTVNCPNIDEINKCKEKTIIVSFVMLYQNESLLKVANNKKITLLAMDMVPRISRAQGMDALSSMANISGYRAVIEAANSYSGFFAGQITAAGKIPPARVLVVGAGVAGLSAIGVANSLGAIVKAFDTRVEVAEQVRSMGAEYLSLDFNKKIPSSSDDGYSKEMSKEFIKAEMNLLENQVKDIDIIITTASIPGKPSPKIITKKMVDSMKSGSVIVDLAALGGGNCEYTKVGDKIVTKNGVIVIGYTDLPNRLSSQSSRLYATNLLNLTKLLTPKKDGNVVLDLKDLIIRNMTLCQDGKILYPPPSINVSLKNSNSTSKELIVVAQKEDNIKKTNNFINKNYLFIIGIFLLLFMGYNFPQEFLNHFIVFSLSCVVGYYVVWNVTHSLHTPLMSVTNAISGIVIIGAILQIGFDSFCIKLLSFIAILIVSINIFGGFYITFRMLNMFRKN